jgi:hypothetical protein
MKYKLGALLFLFILPAPVFATLGQPAASIRQDGILQTVPSQARSLAQALPSAVTTQTVRTAQGVLVKEYLNAGGLVFAIAWSGSTVPDLSQLLGDYFGIFHAAVQNSHLPFKAPLVVKQTQLVVNMGGHMRAYSGSAYLPTLVPNGFDLSVLQGPI